MNPIVIRHRQRFPTASRFSRIGVMSALAAVWVIGWPGCAAGPAPQTTMNHAGSTLTDAGYIQQAILACSDEEEATALYWALERTKPTEDPHLWVAAVDDPHKSVQIRVMSQAAVFSRFVKTGEDLRTVTARLGIRAWFNEPQFRLVRSIGGRMPFEKIFRLQVDGIYDLEIAGLPLPVLGLSSGVSLLLPTQMEVEDIGKELDGSGKGVPLTIRGIEVYYTPRSLTYETEEQDGGQTR